MNILNRQPLLVVLAICAHPLLTACIPTVESVLRPTVVEGEILDGHCPPIPRAVAVVQRHGVTVSVRADLYSNGETGIRLEYEVPESKILRFTDANLKLLQNNHPPLAIELRLYGPFMVGKDLHGATIRSQALASQGSGTLYSPREGNVAKTRYRQFSAQAGLPVAKFDSFTFALPPFAVNGVVVPPVEVTFKREVIGYMGYFNC